MATCTAWSTLKREVFGHQRGDQRSVSKQATFFVVVVAPLSNISMSCCRMEEWSVAAFLKFQSSNLHQLTKPTTSALHLYSINSEIFLQKSCIRPQNLKAKKRFLSSSSRIQVLKRIPGANAVVGQVCAAWSR